MEYSLIFRHIYSDNFTGSSWVSAKWAIIFKRRIFVEKNIHEIQASYDFSIGILSGTSPPAFLGSLATIINAANLNAAPIAYDQTIQELLVITRRLSLPVMNLTAIRSPIRLSPIRSTATCLMTLQLCLPPLMGSMFLNRQQ